MCVLECKISPFFKCFGEKNTQFCDIRKILTLKEPVFSKSIKKKSKPFQKENVQIANCSPFYKYSQIIIQ